MHVNDRDRRSARRNIRDQLPNLGEPILMQNPIADTWNFFKVNEFCVFRNEFEAVQMMKERFDAPELPFVAVRKGSRASRGSRMTAERKSFVSLHLNGTSDRQEFGDYGDMLLAEARDEVVMRARDFFWAGRMAFETMETISYSRRNSDSIQDPHRGLGMDYVGNSLIRDRLRYNSRYISSVSFF